MLATSAPAEAPRFDAFPPELLQRAPRDPAFEFRTPQSRRGIGAFGRLPFADWGVVVAQPLEAAFAPVFSVVTRVFVIDLAIILVFSFLAYEITAKIVRPLEALSDGARRISQGELEVEITDTRTHDEIGLLTRTFNDMARRLRRNRDELEQHHRQLREQNEELQRANEVLEQLSITDGLTKLHNHRYFQESLTREIKRVSRSGDPLAILLVDIDDFKGLNDRYGHAEGDALLVRIARVLNESVRESDILARYGGEEFVVLATGTDQDGALFLAEKVRTAVAETRLRAARQPRAAARDDLDRRRRVRGRPQALLPRRRSRALPRQGSRQELRDGGRAARPGLSVSGGPACSRARHTRKRDAHRRAAAAVAGSGTKCSVRIANVGITADAPMLVVM